MPDRLTLQYDNMLSTRIGDTGIDPAAIDELAERFTALHESVEQRRLSGELAFFALPQDGATVREIRDFAEGVGQAFDTVVVLGIGGSALGASALQQALCAPFWNELDDEARDYYPRLFILDNVDPSTVAPLLDRLDLARTLFNVVSKSGATAETMAQFLIVRERLRALFEDDDGYRRHLIFTTDPEKGVLRRLAQQESIATLPVPPGVGGRFSVLSAVGLMPAALIGVDVDELLAGAAAMIERCASPRLRDNPAGMFAALQYLAHTERAASIHVMMPYTDRLYGIADWFRQLWAESLGKRQDLAGAEVFRGPTPVKALGATDQHSQVQLYMEGPFDKTVTFLTARTLPVDLAIPQAYADVPELGYLGGRTLGELLDAERVATTAALARHGRPNMTIELPHITAHTVGQLMMLLQIATVYAGAFYEVNPLDQPGVELGKQLTYGLMGRAGFASPETEPAEPAFVVR